MWKVYYLQVKFVVQKRNFLKILVFLLILLSSNFTYQALGAEKVFTQTNLPTHQDVNGSPPIIVGSSDGKIALAAFGSRGVFKSLNSGTNWTPITSINDVFDPTTQSIRDVWVSDDGVNQLVLIYGEFVGVPSQHLWLSLDSGATWSPKNPSIVDSNIYWTAVSASDDLSHIYLASDHHWSGTAWVSDGVIYTSTDLGNNFTIQLDGTSSASSGLVSWNSLSASSSGQIIHAMGFGTDNLFSSLDYGATWTRSPFVFTGTNTLQMKASEDGTKILVATDGKGFYLSTDSGSNFSQIDNSKITYNNAEFLGEKPNGDPWGTSGLETIWGYGLGVSRDGSKLAALSLGDYVFLSEDGGISWEKQTTLGVDTWSGRAALTNSGSIILSSSGLYSWWAPFSSGNSYYVRSEYPDSPTIGAATVQSSSTVDVSFTAPTDNGGNSITSYVVSVWDNLLSTVIKTQTFTTNLPSLGTSGSYRVTGLTPSTIYRFSIAAANVTGLSYQSFATTSITTQATSSGGTTSTTAADELKRQQDAAAAAKQKQDQELREILSLVPSIAGLSQSIAGLGNSLLLPQKCVKGKTVKKVKAGAKCPAGYKVKK